MFRSSVLPVVDVEADGAGDGEGQVGDDREHVNPGWPWNILWKATLFFLLLKGTWGWGLIVPRNGKLVQGVATSYL